MVSKNNYSEKMRKIRPQKQRFSIRKFTVGAASVLIGLTFMGINNQEVQADTTVAPEESVKVESRTSSDITEKIESGVNTEEQSVSTANQTEVMSVEENNEVENDVTASSETGNEEVKNDQSISSVETNNVEEQTTNEVVTYNAASTNGDTAVNNQNTNTTETNSVENTTPVEEVQAVENVEENTASVDIQPVETTESNAASVEETQPVENIETAMQKKEALPSTPNYDTAKDQVNNYNQSVNDKFQDKLNGYENAPGLTIVEEDKVTINTNISGVNDSIAEAEKENNQQLANIDAILAQYKEAMDKYKDDLAKYEEARNAYIQHLKDLGLWKEGDEDPLKLSQLLVLGNEENAVAKVETLQTGVTQGSGSILDEKLNIFYKIDGNQTGDFLKVTYTNIQNSTYAGKTISKIVITYSDWASKKLNNRVSGLYFSNNPLDGFFYVGASGVTMDLKLYDAADKLITLAENTAYITVGSLNSTGNGTDYIEKAEVINTGEYRGSGVQLPESSVTVHKGQGEYGGDIVYSEKNNEIIAKYNLSDKDKNTAIGIWGEAAVNKYTGWDEVDRKKEIFGSGLFKVNGIGVKIKFSNALGSAWSTFSTNIPKITFEAAVPEMPNYLIPWHKTEVSLNAQTSVHIHYVDVHEEAKKGTTDFKPEHGKELVDQKQTYHDLAINDQYSNTLWNWESANYILATDSVHPDAIQGTTTENEKHVYVYLKHNSVEDTRSKEVNQVIHYVYEDGSEASPDYKGVTLVFTQTGTKDTVTGEVVWDGEWTQTQRFESMESPTIKGYHTDRPVVEAYDIVVDNSNFDQNLDKEDRVVYVADPVDPEEPTDPVDPEEPTDPVDPEESTDPVDPEEPTDPVDPEEPTDPVDPEESTDPEEPKDPVDPEEPTDPVDPEEPKDPVDSKVPVQAETPTESTNDAPILPDQLSTNTTIKEVATVETKESGKAEAATTEDVSLPQTGHKHSNAGLIGLGLATIASLLGLAGTRKRKKD